MHNPTLRVINILDEVSNSTNGCTLSELSKKLSIPLGTISPIIKTLLNNKLLEFDYETNRYYIGVKSYYIGSAFVSKNTALEMIRQEMNQLSIATGETCQLGMLKSDKVFYLIKLEGKESIRVVSEVGGSLPAYATALGKVLMANTDESEIKEAFSDIKFEKLTENTISDLNTLNKQIEEIKKSGFAFERGESNENTACIAVPIYQQNKCVAAISVAYPIFRETDLKINEWKQTLLFYKKNIEKILLIHSLL